MTGSPRAAVTVRGGDIVRLADGSERTVEGTPSSGRSAIGDLTLIIRFTDGATLRVLAWAELDVERPV
ncbi:hypothetical protein [Streptomyces sp. NBC_01304]|uniref:hypothetical protein n=1 Tax=Streptomyces sp. NBC_01304 TaxID=2903818 RepID=UPI002E0E448A|nr:hypothetical protein OG430_49240 [Streptomyces sp. NBC_01304]